MEIICWPNVEIMNLGIELKYFRPGKDQMSFLIVSWNMNEWMNEWMNERTNEWMTELEFISDNYHKKLLVNSSYKKNNPKQLIHIHQY